MGEIVKCKMTHQITLVNTILFALFQFVQEPMFLPVRRMADRLSNADKYSLVFVGLLHCHVVSFFVNPWTTYEITLDIIVACGQLDRHAFFVEVELCRLSRRRSVAENVRKSSVAKLRITVT